MKYERNSTAGAGQRRCTTVGENTTLKLHTEATLHSGRVCAERSADFHAAWFAKAVLGLTHLIVAFLYRSPSLPTGPAFSLDTVIVEREPGISSGTIPEWVGEEFVL